MTTRTEIWRQIASGERPMIATDYCLDQYATLQKIVDVAGNKSAAEGSSALELSLSLRKIQEIIASDIIDVCIDHETESGAAQWPR